MEIYLAKTQGFCAGVAFAINIVEESLRKYGPSLYVYHEIVHNTYVVEDFKKRGVVFVEDINDVPAGERIVFSAHGVPPLVIEEAKGRNLKYVDATCPLVTKVHNEAVRFSENNYETILLGHKGHQEVIGTAGYVSPDLLHIIEDEHDIDGLKIDPESQVAYITQTTLSADETKDLIEKMKQKFPALIAPPRSDLCYATQNRQDAVKELAKICDVVIICGSPNSSNSNRLRETGANAGIPSYIVDKADELDVEILSGKENVGISSGASVPRCIVDELVQRIQDIYSGANVHTFNNPEKKIVFPIPEL